MLSEQGFLELLKIFPHVSSELFEELCMYERLLRQWQIHINLVANSTLSDFWTRHILDSAQLLLLESKAEIWLDLGSGAGFPGIVIALFLKREEKRSIHLIESNAKKASFLHTVITKLSLPAKVYHMRIEDSYSHVPLPDIITSRALASLKKIFRFVLPFLKGNTTILLHKGKSYLQEISDSHEKWIFDFLLHRSILDSDSVILKIKNLKKLS